MNVTPEQIGRYRDYLLILARSHLWSGLQRKVDASDVVQETLLEAGRSLVDFHGASTAELAAWLRRILANNIADLHRDFHRQKRNVKREVSLEAAVHSSALRLDRLLAADQSSPSAALQRAEVSFAICTAIATLPEEQQRALLLRHCEELTLEQIAERLSVSRQTVVRLIRRGLSALRERIAQNESSL
ncbi:MAG: sigma-70 family RNA polymerase sigma factor [Planctomycetota bacterium]